MGDKIRRLNEEEQIPRGQPCFIYYTCVPFTDPTDRPRDVRRMRAQSKRAAGILRTELLPRRGSGGGYPLLITYHERKKRPGRPELNYPRLVVNTGISL